MQQHYPRLRAKYYENPLTKYNYLLETSARIPLIVREGSYETINLEIEQALMYDGVDYFSGPFAWITYVQHPGQDTCLLIFANTHGSCDGRSCEIVLANLLKLYDGAEVACSEICTSIYQLKQGPDGDFAVEPGKLGRWRNIEADFPKKEPEMLNQTLT